MTTMNMRTIIVRRPLTMSPFPFKGRTLTNVTTSSNLKVFRGTLGTVRHRKLSTAGRTDNRILRSLNTNKQFVCHI